MDDIKLHENTFEALKVLRNSRSIDFTNIVRAVDRGEGFMPWWPVFGVGPGGRVEFVRTEEVYAQLELLAERTGWAFEGGQELRRLPIVDLEEEIENSIGAARYKGHSDTTGITTLDGMLRELSVNDLGSLFRLMETNESQFVLIPVIARGPDTVFRIGADNFLNMLCEILLDVKPSRAGGAAYNAGRYH